MPIGTYVRPPRRKDDADTVTTQAKVCIVRTCSPHVVDQLRVICRVRFQSSGDEVKGLLLRGMSNGSAERDIPRCLDPRILLSYGPVGSKRVPDSRLVDMRKLFPSDGATLSKSLHGYNVLLLLLQFICDTTLLCVFPHACFHLFLPLSLLPAILQEASAAFGALIKCISEGYFGTGEHVPGRDEDGFLVNPLGGIAVDMAGPARYVCYQLLV